jgi:hypothetical protein
MNATNRIRAELAHWEETGELPAAWEPEPDCSCSRGGNAAFCECQGNAPEINDRELEEMNRELDEQLSGSVESPRGGWLSNLRRRER